jgi:hypothetical protein
MHRRVRSAGLLALLLALVVAPRPAAGAECILANPSFELPGSSGATFGGWNQFGSVGSSTRAIHGAKSARVSGPNTGVWDVSGYWQNLVTAPGQRWSVSAWVLHPSSRPLQGGSQAIVNIEWRNGAGGLISYESHIAATAATAKDQFRRVEFLSAPAPTGTASTHVLVGVLQGPTDPVPDVLYDHVTFQSQGPPTPEQRQWLDFPGGRTISFGGRTWRVKGPGYYEPGPSLFSDDPNAVWVDPDGRLHMTIRQVSGSWYSTEVTLEQPLGYGDYVFTTRGRLDTLDPKTVLGIFLWEYGACYDPADLWWNPFNEIDVEFSRWDDPGNAVAQFVVQPFNAPGNLNRFDAVFADGEVTSHAFRWLPNRVEFRSWRGGPGEESPATLIHAWTNSGMYLPRPDSQRVHLNLWQFNGHPAVNQEVVFDAFTFVPACPSTPCAITAVPVAESPRAILDAPRPNPFSSSTSIRYLAPRDGRMEIMVFDVAGRLVRTLHDGPVSAGDHRITWDGRDGSGRPAATGVYLCRFRMEGLVQAKRMILVR